MRGEDRAIGTLFSYVDIESRIPRGIRCERCDE